MEIVRQRDPYDVCIVGSGAGGGMAAMVLAQAGARVALLEAGPMWDTAKDGRMFAWPSTLRDAAGRRLTGPTGIRRRHRRVADRRRTLHGRTWIEFSMVSGTDARRPHEPLGPPSLRFGPDDFRRRSLDGLGDDGQSGMTI